MYSPFMSLILGLNLMVNNENTFNSTSWPVSFRFFNPVIKFNLKYVQLNQ